MVKNLLFHESIDVMALKIGVSGSSGKASKLVLKKAFELGKEIALKKCILVTGGCDGIPFAAVLGAKSAGGKTIAVSPAKNKEEHWNESNYPAKCFDEWIFSGNGKLERNIAFVKKCDAVIFVGGRIGTLNELTIAVASEKIIGLLKGSGGVAENCEKILKIAETFDKEKIVSSADSAELVEKIVKKLGKNCKS